MPEMTDSQSLVDAVPTTAAGPVDPAASRDRPRSLWNDAWHDLSRKPMFYISGALIVFLVLIAIWPQLVASGDPLACDLSKSQLGPTGGHPFGFDQQGCDVF